jgi:NAD(P)-dependent dehydrogenase (short-subunit alcohol dehydrogenase family)
VKLEASQVAVVTGGASGIGRALVEAFAARGLSVVGVDVEASALDVMVSEVNGAGSGEAGAGRVAGQVIGRVVDVRDPEALVALAADVMATFGRVDVVCNNAGVITSRLPTWEQPHSDVQWTTEVNFYGVVNGVRAFVPHFIAAGQGHVVNTASVAGLSTIPGGGQAAYSASKHAVVGLSETLALELATVAPEVGVTVLCPGQVPTRIKDAARNRPADRPEADPERAKTALPDFQLSMDRATPEAVAAMVLAAIEERRFYLVTAPDAGQWARTRAQSVIDGLS